MNLLVGATGFVGGHLVEYLFQQGEISKGVFRKGSHLKIMDTNGVQGLEADLLDHHSLHEAMEGVDVVYNLASPKPGSDDFRVNTEGVLNLLEVATEAKARVFVHLSTIDVYGFSAGRVSLSTPVKPGDAYQRSKAEADRLLAEFSKRNELPKIAVIRAAKAVGARDESIAVPLIRMIKAGKISVPGSSLVSFSSPADIAQAMFKAASGNQKTGSTYLVKSFDATPAELATSVCLEVGAKVEVKKQGLFGASGFSRYTAEQLKAGLRMDDQDNWSELGYAPQGTLKSTAVEIARWYEKEPWVTDAD